MKKTLLLYFTFFQLNTFANPSSFLKNVNFDSNLTMEIYEINQIVPTFENDIIPIVLKRCSPCHTNPKMGLPLWTEYEVVFSKKEKIQNRVVDLKQMPPGQPLDQSELDIIQGWLNAGAPEQ